MIKIERKYTFFKEGISEKYGDTAHSSEQLLIQSISVLLTKSHATNQTAKNMYP